MVAWKLYSCSECSHKHFKPSKGGLTEFIDHIKSEHGLEDYSVVDHTCPLTGKTIKGRGKFWDYIAALQLDPSHMKYDYTVGDLDEGQISRLLDTSDLPDIWTHYFEGAIHKTQFENLVGKITMELYIILLKIYRGEMDIDDCLHEDKVKVDLNQTGKHRVITDQFYTNRIVSNTCIQLWLSYFNNNKDMIVVEPSAGEGSFSDYFNDNNYNIDSYDIEPKKDNIVKQDFLQLDVSQYKGKTVHTIGNPPFGRQSSLAKKFIKHCSQFSDSISFILPKSFRKGSYQKTFPLNFHLEKELDLDKDSFIINGKPHHVPCVFQIWVTKDIDRYVEPIPIETGFKFVKRPTLEIVEEDVNGKPIKKKNIFDEGPDFAILRAGGGETCGRISKDYEDGIACYPEAWLFITIDEQYDKDNFYKEYKKIDWKDDSNVGARSICKPTFIKGINQLLESLD